MLRLYPAPLNNQKICESPQKIFRLVIPAACPHDGEPCGVDERHGHVVLEHGEPEQKILQLFEQLGVNVLSVATDGMDPGEVDKVMEKIRRWNSGHAKKY